MRSLSVADTCIRMSPRSTVCPSLAEKSRYASSNPNATICSTSGFGATDSKRKVPSAAVTVNSPWSRSSTLASATGAPVAALFTVPRIPVAPYAAEIPAAAVSNNMKIFLIVSLC